MIEPPDMHKGKSGWNKPARYKNNQLVGLEPPSVQ